MLSPVTLIRATGLTNRVGYAYAATGDPSARLVLTAAACPLDRTGTVVRPGDHAGQARQVMANLTAALAAAGAHLGDVVKTTVYVASSQRADLVTTWDVVTAASAGGER